MTDSNDRHDGREEGTTVRCARCRSVLAWGEDVFTVETGVCGPRGFVPLEAPLVFCSGDCVIRHFSDGVDDEPQQLARRVP